MSACSCAGGDQLVTWGLCCSARGVERAITAQAGGLTSSLSLSLSLSLSPFTSHFATVRAAMTTAVSVSARDRHLLALALLLFADVSAIDTATHVIDDLGADDVSVAPGILSVLSIAAGLFCGFAGYRFLEPLTFFGGFVAGGYGLAYVLEKAINSNRGYVAALSWLGFAIGGVIGGGALAKIYGLTVLFVGAAAGLFLAYMFYSIFGFEIYARDPFRVFQIAAVVLAVLGGVATWRLERPMLIVTTSFIGAGLTLYGLGYFCGKFPNAFGVAEVRLASEYQSWWEAVPGAWWAYMAAFIALFATCTIVQFEKTSPKRRIDSLGRLTDDRSRLGRSTRANYDVALTPV